MFIDGSSIENTTASLWSRDPLLKVSVFNVVVTRNRFQASFFFFFSPFADNMDDLNHDSDDDLNDDNSDRFTRFVL